MNERVVYLSRSSGTFGPSTRRALVWLAIGISLAFTGLGAASANAAPTGMVDLGQATPYAALSGASVANVVSAPSAPHTTVRGDLGIKADTAPLGFPPGVVTGSIRHGSTVDQAHADVAAAYAEIAGRPGGAPLAGALVGVTIMPGLHTIAAAASNTGTVTLDGGGDPDAVFVIQVNGALAFAAASHVVLANKAQASRVFWQVNGAGALGALSTFAGTLIASAAVGVGNGTIVNGRTFARDGALTLDNNQFYSAPPAVTITGGASAQTTDTTPTVTGTTDVEAPGTVTVTIADQTFVATPSEGTWSVTSAILANGTYPVEASTQDGAGNPGSATQQLTVDTEPPIIVLDGGDSVTTNDATPTISGTSDVAVDTVVTVTVGSQTLHALVHASGSWNVGPAALADGTYTVNASVSDPATNESTDTQLLTIDTIAPEVTIAGGPTALTNDPTPQISGTADGATNSTVSVDVNNETLTALVDGGGHWFVEASALSDGPHRVVMSVSDAAGNRSTFTQMLTVDTVAPVLTINGGASATTEDVDPTITGTSDAAPGSTVTVSIAGQTMTTLLQANHAWNTNPGPVGEGTWEVLASAQDPAGNVGTAGQTLTIGPPPVVEKRTLTISKRGNGSGSVTSNPAGGEFDHGTKVTLTARPETGSSFTDWTEDCSGSSTNCTVTMDQAHSVGAEFVLQKRTLTSRSVGNGAGVVASSPTGVHFDYGTTVTLTAKSAPGSTFTGWGGACSGTSGCTVKMNQARSISARFSDDAPLITKLRVAPRKVHLRGRGKHAKHAMRRRGPAIKVRSTENAQFNLRISGKHARSRFFRRYVQRGSRFIRIPWRVRKHLWRGHYKLTAVAIDFAGQRSKPRRFRFKVIR